MGSSFVAAISSEPVVVLIDDQSILAQWLEEFFLESGLAVCRVEAPALAITLADLDAKGREIYKFVFLHGFTPQSTSLRELTLQPELHNQNQQAVLDAATILSNRTEPVIAITHRSSLNLSELTSPIAVGLQQHLRLEQQIIDFFQATGRAQLFIGVDTLDYTDGIELPLLYSVLGLKNGVIFNPENNWFIQPINAFYTVIANQLLKPHQVQTVLVRGKSKLSSHWLQKMAYLYLQYFGERPSIVSTAIDSPDLSSGAEMVTCQTNDPIQEVLDVKTRALPSLLVEIAEINQLLKKSDRPEIQLSVRDLISRSSAPTFVNNSSELLKDDKNVFLSSNRAIDELTHQTPKNHLIVDDNDKNKLTNQSKSTYLSRKDDEVVVEQWGGLNELNKLIDESNKKDIFNAEKIENEEEKGVIYLDKELQKIFSSTRLTQRKDRTVKKVKSTKKIIFKSKRHRALFYGGLSLVSLGVMVGILIGTYQLSIVQSRKLVLRELQNYLVTESFSDFAPSWVGFLDFQTAQYTHVVKEELLSAGQTMVEMTKKVQSLAAVRTSIVADQKKWLAGLQGGAEYDIEKTAENLVKLTGETHTHLEDLLGLTDHIDIADLNEKQQETLSKTKTTLSQDIDAAAATARFLQIAPDLLGHKVKKTYAVLIQNDLELRPTGGFVQNVVLLTFNRGVLVDSQVYSTYEIDNKLASNVKPPDEIKQVLGEQRWFLRDSNWNPDLSATAKQVNWFIEESLGRSVDGVIALNYSTISNLLKVTGPLTLSEFNEEVTDKNIYDKLEFHAEGKVQNTAGKKVEYTTVLLTQLIAQLKKLDAEKVTTLMDLLYQDLQHHELAWVPFQKDDAQVFKELGWDGSTVIPKCPSQFLENTCVLDALYQVDANVGINKVNGYLEKKIKDQIQIGQKVITHQRSITYTNNAKLDLWPQGTYRAYIKFFMPAEAALQSIQLNSIAISSDKLSIYSEEGRKVVGFLIEVPKQKTLTVTLNYQLNHSFDKPFSYFFFGQKQPGDRAEKDVVVKLDNSLKARVVAPKVAIKDSEITFLISKFDHSAVGITVE